MHAANCTAGEMNYLITGLLHAFLKKQGLNYDNANKLMGVLDCAGKEFYRTVIAPYEDIKRDTNGSVSELDKTK